LTGFGYEVAPILDGLVELQASIDEKRQMLEFNETGK
jgi:hypothetical protein